MLILSGWRAVVRGGWPAFCRTRPLPCSSKDILVIRRHRDALILQIFNHPLSLVVVPPLSLTCAHYRLRSVGNAPAKLHEPYSGASNRQHDGAKNACGRPRASKRSFSPVFSEQLKWGFACSKPFQEPHRALLLGAKYWRSDQRGDAAYDPCGARILLMCLIQWVKTDAPSPQGRAHTFCERLQPR